MHVRLHLGFYLTSHEQIVIYFQGSWTLLHPPNHHDNFGHIRYPLRQGCLEPMLNCPLFQQLSPLLESRNLVYSCF